MTPTGGEFKQGNSTIIFGGGDSLSGAPPSWEWAKEWAEKANESSPNEEIKWSWDCHFKLDYDGDIVRICSRFYPPAMHYGPTWDGYVSVYVFDKEVSQRKFDCETLDELKDKVENYVSSLSGQIELLLQPLKNLRIFD